MNITDIIGDGKTFEPPFRIDNNDYIRDARGNVLIRTEHIQDRPRFGYGECRMAIAHHICDLLNNEHYKKADGRI